MMPQRAHVSRDGEHEPVMHEVPGIVTSAPRVGDSMQVFLDDGKVLRTSIVKRVGGTDSELVVETANSRYRIVLSPAA